MREALIFILIFFVVFTVTLVIFNGRFIYAQLKYYSIGPSPLKGISSLFQKDEFPDKIVIPSIGVEAPIVLVQDTGEYTLQMGLEKGVVLWPESIPLNEKGTMILLGHSSAYPWYQGDYGSVFSLLNKLNTSDEIILFSGDKKYVYQMIDKEIKSPKEINIEQQTDDNILYLISCWPINTDWKRIAIKAKMLDNN